MAISTRIAARDADRSKTVPVMGHRPRASRLGTDFESFVTTLRQALFHVSPLETIVADRLILAAWRLQLASAAEFDTIVNGDDLPPATRATLDAEDSLAKALELLETSRALRLGRDERPILESASEPESEPLDDGLDVGDFSNEWPTLPDDAYDPEPVVESPKPPRWQDRLVFDFNVSETSPVVKGTWVTVGHVVSLIIDGWSWSDVLRTHPELTEDDVRICLAYTVDQDNGDGF